MLMRSKIIPRNYLIKQLPKATAFLNMQLEVVHASDLWLSMFEFSEDYIFGRSINHLFVNMIDEGKKALKNSLKGISGKPGVEQCITIAGEKKWFEWISIPWYDENENVIGTIINSEDITQKVINEEKLKKLELISEDISSISEIGYWEYDLPKDKLTWCDKTRSIHEVDSDYIPNIIDGTAFYKNGYSRNTISMIVNKAISNKTSFSEKLQLVTAKGKEIWVTSSGKPIYKHGKFTGLIGTIQNINELTLKEIKTKENEYLLRTLIDNLPLNIYIKDLDSKRILVNKAEIQFNGLSNEDELLGKDDYEFYDKETATKLRKEDLMVMQGLKPVVGKEIEHTMKNGEETTFLTSKIPLVGSDGNAYGLVGINMDISDLKQKEHELRNLIDVTSLQNEKLINFAHIISHNLRSHSANFSMLIDFLIDEKDKEERERIIQMLLNSSNNLLDTLENLNEVVDINTNTNLKKKEIFINTALIKVQQNLSVFLKVNKVNIINNIPPTTKINVVPSYIESILTNLITNSIKYRSEEKTPIIEISSHIEDKYTVLTIKDNGIGIDLEKYGEKIFGMYKTFHNNKDARGIGLYMTKNQIEAMNGKVTVESKINKGTTFKLFFNEEN